jgi:hypothetical protein
MYINEHIEKTILPICFHILKLILTFVPKRVLYEGKI